MKISDATSDTLDAITRRIEADVPASPYLEGGAQLFADLLYETFEESVVVARVFVTLPFVRLPARTAAFVRAATGRHRIAPGVPVLALAGTRGRLAAWNDREKSRGHLAVPLLGGRYVDSIPMIASLLKQLGLALREQDGLATAIVTQSIGSLAGVFYVEDAATGVDPEGRRIITAQDFVREHGVRTVFGFGGAYTQRGMVAAAVLFTGETIPLRQAERFMPLINVFKAVTMRHALRTQVFADQEGVAEAT